MNRFKLQYNPTPLELLRKSMNLSPRNAGNFSKNNKDLATENSNLRKEKADMELLLLQQKAVNMKLTLQNQRLQARLRAVLDKSVQVVESLKITSTEVFQIYDLCDSDPSENLDSTTASPAVESVGLSPQTLKYATVANPMESRDLIPRTPMLTKSVMQLKSDHTVGKSLFVISDGSPTASPKVQNRCSTTTGDPEIAPCPSVLQVIAVATVEVEPPEPSASVEDDVVAVDPPLAKRESKRPAAKRATKAVKVSTCKSVVSAETPSQPPEGGQRPNKREAAKVASALLLSSGATSSGTPDTSNQSQSNGRARKRRRT